jgi:hypothetical protein
VGWTLSSIEGRWRGRRVIYVSSRDETWLIVIDEDLSTAALRNVERPWKEVVITFTGVEQKVCQDKERLG